MRTQQPWMERVLSQLHKNFKATTQGPLPDRGFVRYSFPWSATFTARDLKSPSDLQLISWRHPEASSKGCPIYKALTPSARRELILRGPKSFLRYRSYQWGLFQTSLDEYARYQPGGVSPFTAMALLFPEPRYEGRAGELSPLLVVPAPLALVDTRGRPLRRRTDEWHIIVWALKRYGLVSWTDVTRLGTDVKRRGTSLRQTIRRNVEEPLAAFYRGLTGKDLDPGLYSAALSDEPTSSLWSRDRMRELKRAARAKRDRNPAK